MTPAQWLNLLFGALLMILAFVGKRLHARIDELQKEKVDKEMFDIVVKNLARDMEEVKEILEKMRDRFLRPVNRRN